MSEKMIAVPESLLIDIGDKIREKRDITTPIPVPDMPMQIGLIEGGSGGTPTLDEACSVDFGATNQSKFNVEFGNVLIPVYYGGTTDNYITPKKGYRINKFRAIGVTRCSINLNGMDLLTYSNDSKSLMYDGIITSDDVLNFRVGGSPQGFLILGLEKE